MKTFLAMFLAVSCTATAQTLLTLAGSPPAAGGGTVTFVASGSGTITGGANDTALTYSFATGTTGADGCIIVAAGLGDAAATTFTTATYNGVAMTLVGSIQGVASGGGGNGHLAIWRLTKADGLVDGTANVVINVNAALTTTAGVIVSGASSWSSVNQTTPTSGVTQTGGTSTTAARTVTSATGSRVIAASNGGSAYSAWAATDRYHNNFSTASAGGCFAFSDRAGSASESMSYTLTSDDWACIGFSLDHD